MPIALVRYGAVPEVVRCTLESVLTVSRGDRLVIETERGLMLGTLLEVARPPREPGHELPAPELRVLRCATPEDLAKSQALGERATAEFPAWEQRIRDWKLDLQLIDIDFTIDGTKQVLYVLNERGPDCTKLAIQAAASGLGIIEVQPVSATGLVALPQESGGGCGSGGCGSGGCH